MMFSGRAALPACLWIMLACACSNSASPPVNPTVSPPSVTPAAPVAVKTVPTVEQPAGEDSPSTPATAATPAFVEFGSEQQIDVDGFQKLPRKVRAAVEDGCGYIGKPIPLLALHGSLWVAAVTKADCMGSGGGYMRLILDVEGRSRGLFSVPAPWGASSSIQRQHITICRTCLSSSSPTAAVPATLATGLMARNIKRQPGDWRQLLRASY